ncbi:MAG TPA: T9SS type A sorting domain-containing protein [Prolixibacteraceae bacterium]|nr:T9SS type A sorting domain-containing protein [Prolixibacteraceae bacterium]
MKTLICILLLIPVLGFAQMNTGAFHSFDKENFSLNQEIRQTGATYKQNASGTATLHFSDDYKILLDSSFISRFRSPSDSSLTRVYYAYDVKGNEILENIISNCFGCSSGEPGKTESEFDSNGNRTKYIMYMLTPTNQYIPEFKVEQSYDSGNKLTHYFGLLWEAKSSQWINYRKKEYLYNVNDELINEVYYLWDINNKQWTHNFKINQSFDQDGNVIFYATYSYNKDTRLWEGREKKEYVFEDKNLLSFVKFNWNENIVDWINSERIESSYDSASNKTLDISYRWNEPEQRWDNYNKYAYSIGSNNKISALTAFDVDANKQWIGSFKQEYSYDDKGNEIIQLRYRWDTETNQWMNEWKYEMDYNSNNQLISKVYYTWNQLSTSWIPAYKSDFWFDQYGNKTKETSHQWNSEDQWIIYYKFEFFYSIHSITNSQDLFENHQLRIYPNPVHVAFTLDNNDPSITQCQIFNSSGQLLQTQPVQMGANTFNISHLRQGMYLLKIKAKEGMVVKKLIKK